MIKNVIEQFYQTMFNYFVKKHGYSTISHYLASLSVMMIYVFLIADIFAIANIIRPGLIGFSTAPKGEVFIIIVIISLLNYLFLFQALKLEKEGDQENRLFVIDEVHYKKTLKLFLLIGISFFVLEAVVIFRQFLEENAKQNDPL